MRFRTLKFYTFSSPWVCYVYTLCYATFFWLSFLLLPYLQVWWCFLLLVWCPYFVPAFLCCVSKLVTCITSYMFHIPSVAVNNFVTKHIARKTISIKVPGTCWSFCVMILNHSSYASGCNMSKIMTYITFNMIHRRSKIFSLKNFFPSLLMGLTSQHFRFCIRFPCLTLWTRFTFNISMKTKTSFDSRRPLTTKNIIQDLSTILKS